MKTVKLTKAEIEAIISVSAMWSESKRQEYFYAGEWDKDDKKTSQAIDKVINKILNK